jgi:hypothetical protein
VKDGGNHTIAFAESATSIEAHNACLDVTIALAATGVRVLIDDEFFAQVGFRLLHNLIRMSNASKVQKDFEADSFLRGSL